MIKALDWTGNILWGLWILLSIGIILLFSPAPVLDTGLAEEELGLIRTIALFSNPTVLVLAGACKIIARILKKKTAESLNEEPF